MKIYTVNTIAFCDQAEEKISSDNSPMQIAAG